MTALAMALVAGACSGEDTSATPGTPAPRATTTSPSGSTSPLAPDGLAAAGARADLLVGVALDPALLADPDYERTVREQYAAVTPENAMKWGPVHPAPDRWDLADADAVVDLAEANGMAVRGHTLNWHRQNPDWVVEGAPTWSAEEAEAILRDHISTLVGRYQGRVVHWDVSNEAIDDDGTWREENPWYQALGEDHVRIAFEAAHAADPDALLFLNDYGIETPGPKQDAVLGLAADLVAAGVPIHGVGLQAHLLAPALPTRAQLDATMARIADMGLEVAVTEADVATLEPPDEAGLAAQRQGWVDLTAACLAQPRCATFVTWGVDDGSSWIPGELPGFGSALLFDQAYQPKPVYDEVLATLRAGRP